ncbi:hypothetical protein ACFY3M_28830 [Streptomyces mirabilis]|uniref:hypothetical protein n=1 Tax=Streptomyces mirabilis TaxID=68239 RepID=UPI0036912D19
MQEYPRQLRVVGSMPNFAARQPTQNAPVLQFFIRLPYHLLIPSGKAFRMGRSADPSQPAWVIVNLRQFDISLADSALNPYGAGLRVIQGGVPLEELPDKSTQSWVVAETLDVHFDEEPAAKRSAEILARAFERCLSAINLLSESSRLVTKEIWSRPLSKDSLDPAIRYRVLDPQSRAVLTENSFQVNHRKINPVSLSKDRRDLAKLISESVARRLQSDAADSPHPFITAWSLALEAESQRVHGASSASIVSLQASMESLLRGLCTMLHRDLKTPESEIAQKGKIPFESIVKRELPGLLGGRWSGPQSVPGEYEKKLYELRNRIVHAGYAPSYLEVNPAFDSRGKFVEFLESRLKERWRRYPKTTLAWHDGLAGGPERIPKAAARTLAELRDSSRFYWK